MITRLTAISLFVTLSISVIRANVKDQKHQGAKVQFFNFNPLAGTYDYGYVTNESGQFHQENRGSDGVTVGCYGYVDPSGRSRITHYVSDVRGYRIVRPNRPVKLFVSTKNSDPDAYDDEQDIIRTEYRPWSSLFMPKGCNPLNSRPVTTTRRPTRPTMQITARPPTSGLDEGSPPAGKPEQDGSLVGGLLGGTDLDLDLNLDQPGESGGGEQSEQDSTLIGGPQGGGFGLAGNPEEDQQGALTPVVGGLVDGLLGGTDLDLDLNLDQPEEDVHLDFDQAGDRPGDLDMNLDQPGESNAGDQPDQDLPLVGGVLGGLLGGGSSGQSGNPDEGGDQQQGALTPVVGGLVDGLLGGTDLELDLNLDQPEGNVQQDFDQTGDRPGESDQPQADGLLGGGQPETPGILTPVVGALVEGLLGGTDLGLDTNIGRVPSYYLPYLYDVPEDVPRIPCGDVDCSTDTFGYLGLKPTVYASKSLADKLGLSNPQRDSKTGQKVIPMHVLNWNPDGTWSAEIVQRKHDSQEEFDAVDS